jgi:hypothetical protein
MTVMSACLWYLLAPPVVTDIPVGIRRQLGFA